MSTLDYLNELHIKVQEMRESGDSDLRTVLYFIDEMIKEELK